MKRTQVAAVCFVVLIGIVGYSVYKHRNRRSLMQNASCQEGQSCGGQGASCATAGYTLHKDRGDGSTYYCNSLGSTEPGRGECNRTGHPRLEIGFPTNGPYQVNTPVPINISVLGLGSGDLVTTDQHGNMMAGGRIDMGDGLGPKAYAMTNPFSITYTFHQIGSTTIEAMAWAQFKYQNGPESGSYESCVDGTATLKIVP